MYLLQQLECVTKCMLNDLELLNNLLEIQNFNCTLKELQHKQRILMKLESELKKSIVDKQREISSIVGNKDQINKNNDFDDISITFIRHAQSEFNAIEENKINQTCDDTEQKNLINCGITKTGMDQCSKLDLEFDLLILSPLKRCQQTLEYSNIKYNKLIIMDIFREYKTDICDFMKDEEIIYETEQDIINRVNISKDILKYIIKDNENHIKSIGIVSHFDFIWYFTSEEIDNERFGAGLNNADKVTVTVNKLYD